MAERKTMRDYIMGSQERTMPKRKTMGEYIIEAKLEALRRQFETFTPPPCEQCGLMGHESNDCPTRNSLDDYEILYDGDQYDAFSSNWYIDYIPPCMKHFWPTKENELDINERLTTLIQNTSAELSQRPQKPISTHFEPNLVEETETITLMSGVDLNEELGHEAHGFIEREETLHEESPYEVNKQDCVVLDMEKRPEVQNVLGTIMLAIGDVVVEVRKGKVNLRCGNEDDVLNALNSTKFSHFISSYFDNVVVTDYSGDLSMQDPLEKNYILQDPNKMVEVDELKISLFFDVHPPQGKTNNNVNHMIRKLRRGNALKVKFSLGEPPD